MLTGVVTMQALFRHLHCWNFMDAASLSCGKDTSCTRHSCLLVLKIFLPPLPWLSPNLRYKGCIIDVLIGSGLSIVTYPLHFDQVWVSVMVPICCRNQCLWWEVRDTPIGLVLSSWLYLQQIFSYSFFVYFSLFLNYVPIPVSTQSPPSTPHFSPFHPPSAPQRG